MVKEDEQRLVDYTIVSRLSTGKKGYPYPAEKGTRF